MGSNTISEISDSRKLKYQNNLYKELKTNKIFDKLGIQDDVTDEHISIDINLKELVIKKKVTHIGLMTFLYLKWFNDSQLCRVRLPFKMTPNGISKYDDWNIKFEKRILFPDDIQNMWDLQ